MGFSFSQFSLNQTVIGVQEGSLETNGLMQWIDVPFLVWFLDKGIG